MRVREEIRVVALKCVSDSPAFDQRSIEVELVAEDGRYWIGRITRRLDGTPVRTDKETKYPKHAWKEVPRARP